MYHLPEAAALLVFYFKNNGSLCLSRESLSIYTEINHSFYKLNGIVFDLQDYIF